MVIHYLNLIWIGIELEIGVQMSGSPYGMI